MDSGLVTIYSELVWFLFSASFPLLVSVLVQCSGLSWLMPGFEQCTSLYNILLYRMCNTGGDQGLLNQFFSDWATKDISRRLPFIYNVVSQQFYTYQPAFKQ